MKNFDFTKCVFAIFIFSSICTLNAFSVDEILTDFKKNNKAGLTTIVKQKNCGHGSRICFQCGNGEDGAYSPTVNSNLPGGNYQFSSVNIPPGVISVSVTNDTSPDRAIPDFYIF
ncbi:MAG: hypothetical protein IPM42_11945 [Saprospiraceae bacterium]|nr:hypothetical protein [Saprospiraceae bacterium]